MDFQASLNALNIAYSARQLEQCEIYFQYLTEQNQVMNLTALTSRDEVYRLHFLDSLHLAQAASLKQQTLLDIGAGAGFPSIVLKIFFPELQITIVDSLQKRIKFLEELVAKLGLHGVTLIHGRAEELKQREHFDLVTARAVARLHILSELSIPFVKMGGAFIAMKSSKIEDEKEEANHAVETLGCVFEKKIDYEIDQDRIHTLLVYRKTKHTPSLYPRTFGQIKHRPL
ncbi:MAG: 16S rRNA (guanine(527)-N(7))-methyltransferase RsmG [Candidatus Izemoplasmatales bacterium]|nr:16S rRNA (guanine(527)-N(7))-methyltransferase RsmG [Candidatus Izemoplasmatales bacterium]